MKMVLNPPEGFLVRTKTIAACHGITIINFIIRGLGTILHREISAVPPVGALARLRQGYHLGGQAFTRHQAHAR